MNESTPTQPAPLLGSARSRQVSLLRSGCWVITSFVVMFIIGCVHSMVKSGVEEARQSSGVQSAHALGLAMYSYASDHGGKYPTGQSSTEIFQQLIDGGYVTDPTLLYLHMSGKTKAEGKKLKPENVCWDVTGYLSVDDAPLPLLFATGYKMNYIAGGKAVPLAKVDSAGFPIFFVNNSARFEFEQPEGIVVMDPTFDPKGKTYHQLTPDGPLP